MSENFAPDGKRGGVYFPRIRKATNGRPLIMGILNITPDSFYSDSRYSAEDAVKKAQIMIEKGADWIDIGGESTRPGASKVSIEEEIERVIPVIKQLRNFNEKIMISIDTRNHQVARLALENGANMVNDVSGLRDKKMVDLIIEVKCAVCIMHMNGEPGNMQKNPTYHDVVEEVASYLDKQAKELIDRGLPRELILIDPGIGFGKTQQHNLSLMKSAKRFQELGYGLLWGISRKSVIGHLTGKQNASQRLSGTLASSLYGAQMGVDILRVHDVDEHNDLFNAYYALNN
jgi:dihydropteroate synthase|tara:strand:+ start:1390 stop:2253 length:864 start_codon:yes stop_codon:yes gene_type:complete